MTQDSAHTKQRTRGDPSLDPPRLSLVIYHQAGTMVVPLVRGVGVVVGRDTTADVTIAEESLSRRHAQFTWRPDGVWVEDLESTNGVYIGAERVNRAAVAAGDEVLLGSVAVSLHAMDPAHPIQAVVSEDAFEEWLGGALALARGTGQPVALVMVREIGQRQGRLDRWLPRVRERLAGHERLGLYGPGWLMIGAEACDRDRALGLARAVASPPPGKEPSLACAIGVAPEDGATVGDLIGVVRALSQHVAPDRQVLSGKSTEKAIAREGLVLESPKMRALFETVRRAASSRVPVLICGETGVGKEFVARALHALGPRKSGPLVAVNCGAIPETLVESSLFGHERGAFTGAERRRTGFLEQASSGTIFLDEIGELSLSAQAALLRAIEQQRISRVGAGEEVPIDVRVVAATNKNLDVMVADGTFRADLLFRLNTVTLEVPPLRERREEIPPLAEHFLAMAGDFDGARKMSFSEAARAKLVRHEWPGNVRELRNAVERAFVLSAGACIEPEDLPLAGRQGGAGASATVRPPPGESAKLKDQVRAYEAELIMNALEQSGYNQTEAARLLHMPVRTLAHKIQQYGLRQRFPGL